VWINSTPMGAPGGTIICRTRGRRATAAISSPAQSTTCCIGRVIRVKGALSFFLFCFNGHRVVCRYFFGSRYLWTADQTADKKEAVKAAGGRASLFSYGLKKSECLHYTFTNIFFFFGSESGRMSRARVDPRRRGGADGSHGNYPLRLYQLGRCEHLSRRH
jgi:hypothetical protein